MTVSSIYGSSVNTLSEVDGEDLGVVLIYSYINTV